MPDSCITRGRGRMYNGFFNLYMPSVPIFGLWQTVQTQIRKNAASDQDLHCLHTGISIKTMIKVKKYTSHSINEQLTRPVNKDEIVHLAKRNLSLEILVIYCVFIQIWNSKMSNGRLSFCNSAISTNKRKVPINVYIMQVIFPLELFPSRQGIYINFLMSFSMEKSVRLNTMRTQDTFLFHILLILQLRI